MLKSFKMWKGGGRIRFDKDKGNHIGQGGDRISWQAVDDDQYTLRFWRVDGGAGDWPFDGAEPSPAEVVVSAQPAAFTLKEVDALAVYRYEASAASSTVPKLDPTIIVDRY